MKQVLILTTMILIFSSCGNNSKQAKFVPSSDTTKIQAVYIDFSDSLEIKNGIVFEIVKNAINVDSTLKVKTVKDSIFYYKPEKDTSRMWQMILRPAISTERNLDSAIMQLRKIVDQIKKQDSLTLKNKKQ